MLAAELGKTVLQVGARVGRRTRLGEEPADRTQRPAAIAPLADALDGSQLEEAEPVSFLPCPLQLLKVDDFGEIEERSGYGRDRNSGAFGLVTLVKTAAVEPNAIAARAELAAGLSRHVNDKASLSCESPKRRGAPMAEQRALATGEHRSHPASPLAH